MDTERNEHPPQCEGVDEKDGVDVYKQMDTGGGIPVDPCENDAVARFAVDIEGTITLRDLCERHAARYDDPEVSKRYE